MKIVLLSTVTAPQLGHVIEAFRGHDLPVAAVLLDSKVPSQKDIEIEEQRTRGKLPNVPLSAFEDLRIPFYFVDSHVSPETIAWIGRQGIDILVNAGTPRIVSKSMIDAVKVGVINCHPGLLPEYRGCTVVEWAIFRNEAVGNTCHFMDDGIDTGPVIAREVVELSPSDSYVDIRVKTYRAGFQLLARGVRDVIDQGLTPAALEPQAEGRYFKPIPDDKLRAAHERIASGNYNPKRPK